MQKDNWRDINDVLIDNLKKANIKHSHGRKFKKVLLWTIGIIVLFVSFAVGIFIYNLNKPFIVTINTNIETSSSFNIKVEKGSLFSNLQQVEIEGFEFVGWFKDAEYTQQYAEYEVVDEGSVLFAAYKVKQFQIDVPLNEAYEIAMVESTSLVNYGEDFTFTLLAKTDYDLAEMQILLNGKVLNPFYSNRHYSQYKIENIREVVVLEVAGEITRYVNLNIYIDGILSSYKVKDTTNLQKILANIDYNFTEYNTMGLFTDEKLTQPANLTNRLLNDVTIYTKKATSINNMDIKWNTSTQSWWINIQQSSLTMVVLPSKYTNGTHDGYITHIVGTLEKSNNATKQVYLPSSLINIDSYAFYNSSKLEGVTIPNTVVTIGNSAFQYCSLLKSVTLSDGVTGIGNFAFEDCDSITSILIPKSVMVIGYYAFRYCANLKYVYFETNSKLNNIGGMAFAHSGITTISIPSSVTIIGYYNFYECKSLTKVTLPNTISIISEYAFYNCVALNDIDIPTNVTTIGRAAFYNCDGLTEITIPGSITNIASSCFYDCDALTKITIPDNITKIEDSAFRHCSKLSQITFNRSSKLTSFSSYAFADCAKLANFTIPDTVTTIGGSCFYNCDALTSITIPDSVTSMSGSSIFNSCNNLTTVTFRAVLEANSSGESPLGSSTFYGCEKLTTITFEGNYKVTTLGSSTFYGCTTLGTITLPSTLTSISSSLFANCTGLTEIEIPSGVTSVGNSAFNGCTSLNSVTIPNTVTSIGNYVFQNCTALTSINIPSSVTNMGYSPFFGCSTLTNLTLNKQSGYSWKAIRLDSNDAQVLSKNETALQYLKGEKGVYYFTQERNY